MEETDLICAIIQSEDQLSKKIQITGIAAVVNSARQLTPAGTLGRLVALAIKGIQSALSNSWAHGVHTSFTQNVFGAGQLHAEVFQCGWANSAA